jgi:hypothetical protein
MIICSIFHTLSTPCRFHTLEAAFGSPGVTTSQFTFANRHLLNVLLNLIGNAKIVMQHFYLYLEDVMRIKAIHLICLLAVVGAALTGFGGMRSALAGSVNGVLTATIDCGTSSVIYNGGALVVWDRDNTGVNAEAISYTVYDAASALLSSFTDTRMLGQTAGFAASYAYAPTAAYPITVRLYSAAGNSLSETTIFSFTGNCGDTIQISGGNAGAPIPAGFILRTINCDVAVFDSPDGHPVGDNRILSGQSWYVNPKSVKGPRGDSWTEIFVSSALNPFIPTKCVGSYPSRAPVGGQ